MNNQNIIEYEILKRYFDAGWLKKNNVHQGFDLQQESCPISLLNPSRFDLMAKYIYVKFYDKKIKSDFGKELYLEHIRIFNGFIENDNSNKIGKEAFESNFNKLIESIKSNGFDINHPVPVSPDNLILDGSHRLATAIYYNKKVSSIELAANSGIYDYKYFLDRGCNTKYLDCMALEYAKLKKRVYLVLIYPSAEGKEKELLEIFKEYGSIVYRKEVFFNQNGAVNLVRNIYKTEKWLGNYKNSYAGARNKASWCFSKNGNLKVFLLESNQDMVEMKHKIRNIFKVDKHSIHINDTYEELIDASEMLFNDSTIHYLNNANVKEYKWFNKLFTHYESWIEKNKYDKNSFCVVGSSPLATYGLREIRDLDYLTDRYADVKTGFKEIDCHNSHSQFYIKHTIDDIIYNPLNYFYYKKHKFLNLNLIKEMKKLRNEEKDKYDIQLIQSLNSKKVNQLFSRIKYVLSLQYIKYKIKSLLLRTRYAIKVLKNGNK